MPFREGAVGLPTLNDFLAGGQQAFLDRLHAGDLGKAEAWPSHITALDSRRALRFGLRRPGLCADSALLAPKGCGPDQQPALGERR